MPKLLTNTSIQISAGALVYFDDPNFDEARTAILSRPLTVAISVPDGEDGGIEVTPIDDEVDSNV